MCRANRDVYQKTKSWIAAKDGFEVVGIFMQPSIGCLNRRYARVKKILCTLKCYCLTVKSPIK